jgi:catechol 2,3-dioxygenase-like lactoylglutathione lyase family enzyme
MNKEPLGRFDLCLNVKDVKKSAEFYMKLGLEKVEGNLDENWIVLAQGNLRLGLYQGHIEEITLNFRGGDVIKIGESLKNLGYTFEKGPKSTEKGASAELRDPDGYLIFFDTHVSEKKILDTLKVEY